MARAPLLYELESEFNTRVAEELGHQNLTEYYKTLLTGVSQTAQSYAQSQYQAQAKTAAEQASYDISGAYANYLKQQRNIAAQGHLESGYKEEVGDVLQQQYQSAYGQAKSTQAETLTTAKKNAQDLYSDIYGELSKSAQTQIESIEKQSAIKANLANAMIEQAQLTGDKTYDWFTVNEEGKTTLSDWGYDQMSKYLMTNTDAFTKYLQDKGLEDELKYYLSNPTDVRREFFDITETAYDPLSEASLSRRLGATSTNEKGEVVSYIDTIEKPTVDIHWTDYGVIDWGTSASDKIVNTAPQVEKYMTQLGVSNEDLKQATGYSSAEELLKATAKAIKKAEDGYSMDEIIKSSGFNEAFGKVFVTSMLYMFKGVNQGNTQQFARDTYENLMNQIADISKQKYLKKE